MTRRPRAQGRSRLALCALALAACDGGRQVLAWETASAAGSAGAAGGDSYAPWYGGPDYYRRWTRGPSPDPDTLPIGVWMQDPVNAARYREIGVGVYVGLWQGPTEEQLAGVAAAGMSTMCEPTGVWESHLGDATIQGWLQPDGPDNAQALPDGSYAPCMAPADLVARYEAINVTDGSRPVYIGFGRGVASTDWIGRGTCTGRTEMYPEYVKGGDILAFCVYPLNQGLSIELVAQGVDNLLAWSSYQKPVIAVIEASSFTGAVRPSPADLRAEAWMALIHGAAGIEYYCHRWEPTQSDIDCLEDPVTAAALATQNRELAELAPVLNSPTVSNGLTIAAESAGVRVDALLKRQAGASYVFAIAMGGAATRATLSLARRPNARSAEVLGEARSIPISEGTFSDDFGAYQVHLYRIAD